MLFHSYQFIFGFLPITFLVFVAVHALWGWERALLWLAGASLFFYGQWSLAHAALLAGSIVVNYGFARLLRTLDQNRTLAFRMLLGGIAANLALLGYFKYTNFLIDNINWLSGESFSYVHVFLPIGISFYTFIQIGYLVEVYNRQVEEVRFGRYLLFASFFPCITAGPIVLQKEMMGQFAAPPRPGFNASRIAVGLTVFGIGLFKKLVLADGIAPYADAVFDGVAGGAVPASGIAWTGALAYTLQLYFDFSGYSDMALGIGHLFGLKLPLNFNSPLKAYSIQDFWRRWHMTMTRFFTSYLYSPIAMAFMRRAMAKRHGRVLRFLTVSAAPVTATFVLAGLWHGAGWTFIVFGLIHGVALAVNQGWREARMPKLPQWFAWLLTMTVVVVGLVFFRAASVPVAVTFLTSMLGLGDTAAASLAGNIVAIDTLVALVWIVILGAIVLGLPNTQEVMRNSWVSSDPKAPDAGRWPQWLAWRPTPLWAAAAAVVIMVALGSITSETAFIYYQF